MPAAYAHHRHGGIIARRAAVEAVAFVDNQPGGELGAVFWQVVGHGVVGDGIARPAEVHQIAHARVFRAVAHGDEYVVQLDGEGALPDGLAGNHARDPGIVEQLALAQHDGGGVIKLDDVRGFVVQNADDGEGRIGHLAHAAHRQRACDGGDALLQRDAAGDHGAENLAGEGGEDVGLHPAAQAVGQHQRQILVPAAGQLHLVAAEGFAVLVHADGAGFNPQVIHGPSHPLAW